MPIYEYQCSSCGAITSALQKMGAGPDGLTCACGSDNLKKMLSAANVGASSHAHECPGSCGMPQMGGGCPSAGGCGGGMCGM
ncbi:MAG TPA: zinc ribbon domain-containing protein [Nitrospirota bacterium]